MDLLGHYNYYVVVVLMMIGFYAVIACGNMAKKIMGLNLFQTSAFILFISAGKILGGSTPILRDGVEVYSNPLPHVLILTAIVVGVATTAVGLALAVRINEAYGSIEDDLLIETEDGDERRRGARMTVLEWLPFSVLVPLVAAPVCALLPGRVLPWLMAFLSIAASAVITAFVLPAAMDETLRYSFGNWPPPIGIEYRVDSVNALLALLIAWMAVVILPWARLSVNQEVPERQGPFYALFMLAFAGLMGIVLTGDAFNVFVFLEISSLSTYALDRAWSETRGTCCRPSAT
jgi:multisubunit Na+/H+ antiporter MnhC subunit